MKREKRVLFVDDETNILSTLKRLLRSEDYCVETASSGYEALKIMELTRFDVIVSDQRMPHMTGAELLQIVSQKFPGVKRLMLSGYADIESVICAVNEGKISEFLTKPWNVVELRKVIRKHVFQSDIVTEGDKKLISQLKRMRAIILKQKDKISVLEKCLSEKKVYLKR